MKPDIRPALAADCIIVHRFICELEEQLFDLATFTEIYLHHLASENNIYLVAEAKDAGVIGFISCHGQSLLHHAGMAYEIQELFVTEQFRSQGVGAQLVSELETRLKQRECKVFEVSSHAARTMTHAFYSRLGFRRPHLKFTKEW